MAEQTFDFQAKKVDKTALESFGKEKTLREPCNPEAIAYCTKIYKLGAKVKEAKERGFEPMSIIALMELHPECGTKVRSYMPSAGGNGFKPRGMNEEKIMALLSAYGIPEELIAEAIAYHKPRNS